jgi:hypothetical protein
MQKFLLAAVVAATVILGGMAALADPPDDPSPGADCSHGINTETCRPDPNENGQDCEAHGTTNPAGNDGNEDHCVTTSTTSTTISTTAPPPPTTTTVTTETVTTTTETPTTSTTTAVPSTTTTTTPPPPRPTSPPPGKPDTRPGTKPPKHKTAGRNRKPLAFTGLSFPLTFILCLIIAGFLGAGVGLYSKGRKYR